MPELPEVETIARGLANQVQHHRIVAIDRLDWERMIEAPTLEQFTRILPGRSIIAVGRRAKWLLMSLDAGWTLALHLRMSGRIIVADPTHLPDSHTHLVLRLDDGRRIHFHDQRKFGRARLLNPSGLMALHASFGPEPLADTFLADDMVHILSTHHARLKPLLLNQAIIAGLGNIYVDESLWHARLHPLRFSHTLTVAESTTLYAAIRAVLHQAIICGGSTLRDYRTGYGEFGRNQENFSVYGRSGGPCPACGTPVRRIVVAQRGTHICPSCQQAPAAQMNV